ncbi:pyridoxamine 5'-phosphate oxidase family protein [Lactiplantibacillus plantarum]|uniref:pyridoxamine 5'-phosphate oxidase family protein n=1 Tax=Lactiplantibacillus plantarum TaxID=1590 RepID=UPI0013D39B8F|nr:pyridoxamine 5'-phosphate oxidase family protein [Lactiplantibacillus plantarum]MCT3228896.1 pyridoxamine 5'-phosphate oxidase family protein [Lactiplantibacillus plantarum]NFA49969.1 pyridoxamine 5'-phosphate oxidase family protein [Lactiplantibacillus plantarum]WGS69582.1 pyridoxamine 5'-phosphate oxidase family protein [Lactiplantibacillus plantarum]
MQHTTRQAALHMIQTAPVFTLATVDADGFPTMVALSPLPIKRSLEELYFYTSRQTSTTQNIQNWRQASLFYYQLSDYASIMLRGKLSLVGTNVFEQDWRAELTDFQQQLNHKDPVILRFQTSSIKIRQMMTIDHLELVDQPTDGPAHLD